MNPKGNEREKWQTPLSLEDWKANRASTKLDVLLEIITHHLATNNAPPLAVGPNKRTLVLVTRDLVQPCASNGCDHIIIFSMFLSSNLVIQDVHTLFPLIISSLHLLPITPTGFGATRY